MNYINNFIRTDSRFEKKYIIKFGQLLSVNLNNIDSIKKLHDGNNINNIYFDTLHNDFLNDHIEGNLHRIKTRIRWYSHNKKKIKYFFEIKIKKNFINYKIKKELVNFKIDNISLKYINDVYNSLITQTSFSNYKYKFIKPILYNNYNREYFYKSNRQNRITVDKNLYTQALNINFAKNRKKCFYNYILEHKYPENKYQDLYISNINFINSSFSKYLYGLE